MNITQAKALRDQWRASGSKPCTHDRTAKERHELGAQTGDLVCLDCGATWWHTEPKPGPAAAAGY